MGRGIGSSWVAAVGALVLIGAAPLAVFSSGGWAAFDRGTSCEAVGRSERIDRDPLSQPHAAFVFDRSGPRRGQFAAQLTLPVRPDSTVLLTVGDQPFLLVARDRFAWSRGPAQEHAIMSAVRFAPTMRIKARSPGGGRFVDRYALAGAAGAIDAAAACSVRRG
ncbi:MAG: hypothetical protein ABIO85_03950 [Sphingomicrobium sp.]